MGRGRIVLALLSGLIVAGVAQALTGVANQSAVQNGTVRVGCTENTLFACLLGRAGGQTLIGGTNAFDTLIFNSTSNAQKANIEFFGATEVDLGNPLTNSTSIPLCFWDQQGASTTTNCLKAPAAFSSVGFTYTLPAAVPTANSPSQFLTATTTGVQSYKAVAYADLPTTDYAVIHAQAGGI